MKERELQILEVAPILLLSLLFVLGLLILGRQPLRQALHDWWTGDDQAVVDPIAPVPAAGPRAMPSIPQPATVPTISLPIDLAPVPTATVDLPCAGFRFSGSLRIEGGRVSFGRFNVITDTAYGQRDPLAKWKLIQFESLTLPGGEGMPPGIDAGETLTMTVDQAVNMLVRDPFTEDLLFSARWQIDELAIRGDCVGINARLATNLSDIRVNNAIQSETLASLSRGTDASTARGVLALEIRRADDALCAGDAACTHLAAALREGEPVYAIMSGVVYAERCLR
jgi:hypothetical protein